MHHQSEAAIIANDLDSLVHRIEALPAHPQYTAALSAILDARAAIGFGRADLHQRDMEQRHGKSAA